MGDEKSDCVFCRIASGGAPAQIILENDLSLPSRHQASGSRALPGHPAAPCALVAPADRGGDHQPLQPGERHCREDHEGLLSGVCYALWTGTTNPSHPHLPDSHLQGRPHRPSLQRAGRISGASLHHGCIARGKSLVFSRRPAEKATMKRGNPP